MTTSIPKFNQSFSTSSGTRELRTIFEERLTAREIASPLVSFDASADAKEVHAFMERERFDTVGIRRDGLVRAHVTRRRLASSTTMEQFAENLEDDLVIDDSAPMLACLKHLAEQPWVFVRAFGQVSAIVTRSDLHRQPVRLWLFGLIGLFELEATELIRRALKQGDWEPQCKADSLAEAKRAMDRLQPRDEDLELLDCLQLADKCTIVAASAELRRLAGYEEQRDASDFFRHLKELRNDLAHGRLLDERSWKGVYELALEIEEVVERLDSSSAPSL